MTPYSRICEYYERIDANDIDWVLGMFTADACYRRADAEYRGGEIEDFFRNQRKIRGEHRLEDVHSIDNKVITRGEFVGTGVAGDERRVGFVDFWFFDTEGHVELRETYLAVGNEIVKD
jgi:hypothetical protein